MGAWLACGCGGASPLPTGGPTTADDVLARALARPIPETVQGLARLDSYMRGQARKAELLVAVRRPDAVQMQVLSPTLDMLAVLSTDGRRFVSFERGGRQCQTGAACPENLARIVPIALPANELVLALLGRPPLLDATPQVLAWDGRRKLYRIDIGPREAQHQEVFVEPESFRFAGTVLYQGRDRLASIAYEGEVQPGGPPRSLRFRDARRDVDVSVTLRDVEVGAAIDDERFAIACPAGMTVVELPCAPTRTAPPSAPARQP